MNYKLSVIVPVYNVEEYIEKCIESIINQTYTNLEIILVNDGSTDESGNICDMYAKKDSRIKVFHKENGGTASAKNMALDNVTGDYITFVDSDDWIDIEMYKILIDLIKCNNVDMVCCNYTKVYNDHVDIMSNASSIKSGVILTEDILYYAFNRDHYKGFGAYLVNKIFKKDKVLQCRFNEELKIGEDVIFFVQVMLNCSNGMYYEKALYNYFQRETSLMHSDDIMLRSGSLSAYQKIIECLANYKCYSGVTIWIKRFYCFHVSILVELAIKEKNIDKIREFQVEMRRYLPEYIETNKNEPERITRINALLEI